MPGPTSELYRVRMPATPSAPAIIITSVPGGTNPWIAEPPKGDGASFDPLTGQSMLGSYSVTVIDGSIGGSPIQRILTSQLEDASLRQQLGYRATFIEISTDGGATWSVMIAGVLSLLRLVDAITWELTVQDPMRTMDETTLFSPASATPIMTFVNQWPNRGCLAGGPIMTPAGSGGVGPLGIQDLGGWQMRVESLTSTPDSVSTLYVLRPVVVYGPPTWIANKKSNLNDFADQINQAAAQLQSVFFDEQNDSWSTVNDAMSNGYCWQGLTWLIDTQDGTGYHAWKPYPFGWGVVVDSSGNVTTNIAFVAKVKGNWGIAAMPASGQTLTVGSLVKVRAISVLPTEQSPIYLQGHPCDLLTQLFTAESMAYDATSVASMKSVLGSDALMTFRITEGRQMSDLVKAICGPWGIGIRGDAAGELQLFDGRLGSSNSLPSVTITSADVLDGSVHLPFELDPSQAAQTVTFEQKHFTDQHNVPSGQPIPYQVNVVDGVAVGDDSIAFINGDASAIPYGTLDLSTDAMIGTASANNLIWQQYATTFAQTIFNRFGHGGLALELTLLRGGNGDLLNLGDEALINIPQLPNHNYRLGDNNAIAYRRMQIVRRTVTPIGYEVRFVDSGPNAQPLPTVPTLTIAATSDGPRTIATFTITNAATLNAAGYGARVQWAVTTGASPSSGQWTDIQAWGPALVPTAALRLPAVTAGSTVWVRGRSELSTALPSNWSTGVSVSLATIAAPTGLTATPNGSDGSLEAIAWAPGSGTSNDLVDLWLRTSTQAFNQATRIQSSLMAGTIQYVIEGLQPSTAYIASVQYRDPRNGAVSSPVDVSFTTGGTTRTLNAPFAPVGFCGSVNSVSGIPNRDGTYGIAVIAAEVPGYLEVAVATETAVGSGTYGSFVTQVTKPSIASIAGSWTTASFVAPNDGKHRQLKARHVLDGCTPSAYTSVVTVLPWTPQAIGPMPTAIQVEVTQLTPSPTTDAGVNLRFQIDAVDPFGQVCQVEIVSLQGSGVAPISGFPGAGTLEPNDTIFKISLATTGSGPGTAICRGISSDGRHTDVSVTIPEIAVPGIPQATCSVTNGSWQCPVNLPPTAHSFYYLTSTTALPSVASTISSGTPVTSVSGVVTLASPTSGPALAFGQTIYGTVVPFTGTAGTTNGTQMKEMNFVGAFITYGPSKTAYYASSQFAPDYSTVAAYRIYQSDASLRMQSNLTSLQTADFSLFPTLPNNVTITNVSFESYWSSGIPEGVLSVNFTRVNGTSLTSIGSGSPSNTGWQSIAISMSESTAGNSYRAHVQFEGPATPSELGQAGVAISYTASDPSTTL